MELQSKGLSQEQCCLRVRNRLYRDRLREMGWLVWTGARYWDKTSEWTMVAEPLLEKEHSDNCTSLDFDLLRIHFILLHDLQGLQIEANELARQETYHPRAFQPCQRYPLLPRRPCILVHHYSFWADINTAFYQFVWRRWLHYQIGLLRIQPESQALCEGKVADQN